MAKSLQLALDVSAHPSRLWETLATPKGLAHWWSDGVSLDPRAGGRFRFHGSFVVGGGPGREFDCEILAWEPERKFGFSFPLYTPEDSVIHGTITFVVEASGSQSRLSIKHELERLPENPNLLRDLWAYYGNIIGNTTEHDFHEPGLRFDFSRSWKGNFRQVIYLETTPDRVFRALHDPALLAKYFTEVKRFEAEENGRIDFGWARGPSRVLLWEPPAELAYDWPVEQGGDVHIGQVKWLLEPEGRATRVALQVSGFGGDVDHYRAGDALGWVVVLLDMKRYLESGRPSLYQSCRIEG